MYAAGCGLQAFVGALACVCLGNAGFRTGTDRGLVCRVSSRALVDRVLIKRLCMLLAVGGFKRSLEHLHVSVWAR